MSFFKVYIKRSFLFSFLLLSCSSQVVMLNPKAFFKNQTVKIETADGENVAGVVLLANADAVLIKDSYGEERGFLTKNIVQAQGPQPIMDNKGVLVSEAEIDSMQTNTNLTAYAIVGGLISGGVSFLGSSLLTHEVMDSDSDAPVYIGTTAGLTAGTLLFAQSGARKDREKAIENVLASRAESGYEISLPDQNDDVLLREKIREIVEERQKMEAQIDSLLNEMDNIEEPSHEEKK